MHDVNPSNPDVERLRREVNRLQDSLKRLRAERDRAARRRRRRLLTIGVGVSLLLHVLLMVYFGTLYRWGPGEDEGAAGEIEFAMVFDEDLAEAEETSLDGLEETEPALEEEAFEEPAITLEGDDAASELEASGAGAMPTLGGSGGADDAAGMSGGGGGTSYFGVAGEGNRFAYIVDRSGSMRIDARMEIAKAQLIQSIESLPDYTHFSIVYFSSEIAMPPMQDGWLRASRRNVARVTRWIENEVASAGGTEPRPAFLKVFDLEARPDVVYFMTDGIIRDFSAEEVDQMNRQRGRPAVIHTIAFGDQGSEDLLRRIAEDSGGEYRYVPDGGP